MTFDYELKLRRALKHLNDLDSEVVAWLRGDHHTVRYEYDPQAKWDGPVPPGPAEHGTARYFLADSLFIPGHGPGTPPPSAQFGQGVLTAYATAENPPTDPLSLLIGDVVHNLRSALDSLAFALATAFTTPLPEKFARTSEFPIFGDEDGQGRAGTGRAQFNRRDGQGRPARGSGLAKIQGWHPSAQAAVEQLQPYQRGLDFRADPLWVVHELDRLDKHRLLHTVVAGFAGSLWDIQNFRNVRAIGPGFIESMGGALHTETPIGRICGLHPIDPKAEMHVKIRPALHVVFSPQTTVAGRAGVVETLRALYFHIDGSVVQALLPFL